MSEHHLELALEFINKLSDADCSKANKTLLTKKLTKEQATRLCQLIKYNEQSDVLTAITEMADALIAPGDAGGGGGHAPFDRLIEVQEATNANIITLTNVVMESSFQQIAFSDCTSKHFDRVKIEKSLIIHPHVLPKSILESATSLFKLKSETAKIKIHHKTNEFKWTGKETDNMNNFNAWLHKHITFHDLNLLDVHAQTQFMSYLCERKRYMGSTDFVISMVNDIESVNRHINITIELKMQAPESRDRYQTMLQLISASQMSKDHTPVVSILTDVNTTWIIYWYSAENTISFIEVNRPVGMSILQALINKHHIISHKKIKLGSGTGDGGDDGDKGGDPKERQARDIFSSALNPFNISFPGPGNKRKLDETNDGIESGTHCEDLFDYIALKLRPAIPYSDRFIFDSLIVDIDDEQEIAHEPSHQMSTFLEEVA
ncbi:hypothetical protein SAMD00019534_085810 [Acytostelium subglobosum LB1]|uniref:hypothetical protein n=1 Tax=Acytostelium subglobosum LB1 TaxID=1410327 RepID=UPI00064490DF|nr:hypothetical protein SAMD00019534_085810 [Acytostelium subglobosum LB1]GAM25406.1 hypothetical protein SAMD00019534_085810 [Acytostelium subglobosum LB1]|eukprot:XP_012751926.1 hypothetical protein SAMD00019534_085810 [Acytostelium subglobosum LB1]